jgi:uncharacterized membrane protein
MNIALWVTQGILAFVFVMAGGMKLFSYQKYRAMLEKSGPTSLTHGLITFLGIAELAGTAGMVLPMALNIAPWLTVWAAAGMAVIMLSATVYHVRRREPPIMTGVLFVLAVGVVVGRGHGCEQLYVLRVRKQRPCRVRESPTSRNPREVGHPACRLNGMRVTTVDLLGGSSY